MNNANIDDELKKQRKVLEMSERKIFLKSQGRHIAKLRKQHGFNQFDFGEEVNLVINSVSKIERGLADTRIYTLYKMAKVLGVSLAEITDFKIQPQNKQNTTKQNLIDSINTTLQTLDEEKLQIIKKQIEAFK